MVAQHIIIVIMSWVFFWSAVLFTQYPVTHDGLPALKNKDQIALQKYKSDFAAGSNYNSGQTWYVANWSINDHVFSV